MRLFVLSAAVLLLGVGGWAEPMLTFTPDTATVAEGGQPVLRYRYGGVPYKPYVDLLTTPSGINILRDAPHDHLHHHALMFAVRVNDINYWEEAGDPGVQRHMLFTQVSLPKAPSIVMAGFEDFLNWLPTADTEQPDVLERRRIVSHGVVHGAQLITWRTEFIAVKAVRFDGAHYHGLGMRFVESMDKVGAFRIAGGAEGEVVRGTEKLTPGNWAAYTAPVAEKPVTVAMFDHPDNIRPVLWFTMLEPFSYLSATIDLQRAPLELHPAATGEAGNGLQAIQSESMALTYGVAVWDGDVPDEAVNTAYEAWLAAQGE
jgi:hypothetical protein